MAGGMSAKPPASGGEAELCGHKDVSFSRPHQTGYMEEFFYSEGGETLARVARRGGRCPIRGNTPGQVGRGSEKPDPGEDVPAHGRGVGLDDL